MFTPTFNEIKTIAGISLLVVLMSALLWFWTENDRLNAKLKTAQVELVTIKEAEQKALEERKKETAIQKKTEEDLQSKYSALQTSLQTTLTTYKSNFDKSLATKDAEIAKLKTSISKSQQDLLELNSALAQAKTEAEKIALEKEIALKEAFIAQETIRQQGLTCLTVIVPSEYITNLNNTLKISK